MDLLYVAAGLLILIFAGDALVKGAVNLALRLGIPPLVVGLTVVAFGTSAPELLVSISAVLEGQSGIALGNVVGSNIANILLILGLPAIITTIHSSEIESRRSYVMMIAATLLFIAICALGPLLWWHAILLLGALCLVLLDNLRSARAHRAEAEPALEGVEIDMPMWQILALLVGGLIGLAIGANLLVDGAVNIARVFGVSETVIGLTLVAIGTSLPELVTSIAAAFRKQADVAMGNVIGSNTFNLLGIVGGAGLFGNMDVPTVLMRSDVWIMLAVSLLLIPFVLFKRDITRLIGLGMVGLYMAYTVSLVV